MLFLNERDLFKIKILTLMYLLSCLCKGLTKVIAKKNKTQFKNRRFEVLVSTDQIEPEPYGWVHTYLYNRHKVILMPVFYGVDGIMERQLGSNKK